MLTQNVLDALNDQVRDEFHAEMQYLAIAAYFEDVNLPGMAAWMRIQADEERTHALKIFDFVLDRGGKAILHGIGAPVPEFDSPLAAFQAALAHEQGVTQSIYNIYALAKDANDYPTQVMMEWFITEQVEEEKITGDVVAQLEMVGNDPTGILLMDQQLGARGPEDEEAAE
jgi:ferritin